MAAANKGSPIYKAVARILDEHSAWIARPNDDVTKAVALAAGVAWMAAEKIDPSLSEMDATLSDARAALAAAQADAERLREALMPFARMADAHDSDVTPSRFGDDEFFLHRVVRRTEYILTFGDLRRARAALAHGGVERTVEISAASPEGEVRYDLMTTEQVPPSEMAEWLLDPEFAAYVQSRRTSLTQGGRDDGEGQRVSCAQPVPPDASKKEGGE